jgi:protein SCO1
MNSVGWRVVSGVVALALLGCTEPVPTFKGTDVSRAAWGGDVTLQAHTGKPVSTADFRGKVLLLFFGYTHCPDICAPTLTKLAAVRQRLGADADKVQVLFVSVDSAHDTPQVVGRFVAQFDPSFIGLRGDAAEIAAVAREYKVAYAATHAAAHAMVEHSGNVLVKDANGKLRLLFRNEASAADIEHDLRLLLKQIQ